MNYKMEIRSRVADSVVPSDVSAEVRYALSDLDVETVYFHAYRPANTDLVIVSLRFIAADDDLALSVQAVIPPRMPWPTEASGLMCGRRRVKPVEVTA